jgi:transaldolase
MATLRQFVKSKFLSLNVMTQLAKHPLTDIGIEKFLADWEKTK